MIEKSIIMPCEFGFNEMHFVLAQTIQILQARCIILTVKSAVRRPQHRASLNIDGID